jgi:hypothetical protein
VGKTVSACALIARHATHVGGAEFFGSVFTVIGANVITPVVFWASLVPCANATREADTTWQRRKSSATISGAPWAVIRYANRVATRATMPATIGDSASGSSTLPSKLSNLIASVPAYTHVAPIILRTTRARNSRAC